MYMRCPDVSRKFVVHMYASTLNKTWLSRQPQSVEFLVLAPCPGSGNRFHAPVPVPISPRSPLAISRRPTPGVEVIVTMTVECRTGAKRRGLGAVRQGLKTSFGVQG